MYTYGGLPSLYQPVARYTPPARYRETRGDVITLISNIYTSPTSGPWPPVTRGPPAQLSALVTRTIRAHITPTLLGASRHVRRGVLTRPCRSIDHARSCGSRNVRHACRREPIVVHPRESATSRVDARKRENGSETHCILGAGTWWLASRRRRSSFSSFRAI